MPKRNAVQKLSHPPLWVYGLACLATFGVAVFLIPKKYWPVFLIDTSEPPLPEDYSVTPGETVYVPTGQSILIPLKPLCVSDEEQVRIPNNCKLKFQDQGDICYLSCEIPGFHIDRYEVTAGEFQECVREGVCSEPRAASKIDASDPSTYGKPTKSIHPINGVGPIDAEEYCSWVGKEVPTRSQWRRAASGDTLKLYPWGDDDSQLLKMSNLCGYKCNAWWVKTGGVDRWGAISGSDDEWPTTAPIGAMTGDQSVFGVNDMFGNVTEWVRVDPMPQGLSRQDIELLGPEFKTTHFKLGSGWMNPHTTGNPNMEHLFYTEISKPHRGGGLDSGFRCVQSSRASKSTSDLSTDSKDLLNEIPHG